MTLCASEPLMLTGVLQKSIVHIVYTVIYTHTQTYTDSDHIRTAMARSLTQFSTLGVQQIRTSPVNCDSLGDFSTLYLLEHHWYKAKNYHQYIVYYVAVLICILRGVYQQSRCICNSHKGHSQKVKSICLAIFPINWSRHDLSHPQSSSYWSQTND